MAAAAIAYTSIAVATTAASAAQAIEIMTDTEKKSWTEKGIEDSAKGKVNDIKGKVKDAVGSLTGDTSLELEGKVDQLKGKVQDTVGKVERKIDEVRRPDPTP